MTDRPPDMSSVLLIMAYGMIHASIAEDYWTQARIQKELAALEVSTYQVAQVWSLAAGALATRALKGEQYDAMDYAAGRYQLKLARWMEAQEQLSAAAELYKYDRAPLLVPLQPLRLRPAHLATPAGRVTAAATA